ncbi:nuclear transport factor 2 family protein [Parablastomonas sp. CN1-191]|uniref:nuclear transport factor 2 family protein n=1 Tax=Parablastomonas sp. CN1-191 TaxID=3400908 RepID=UPI003BF8AE30
MNQRDFCKRFLAAMRAGDDAAMERMIDPEFELVEAQSLPYGGMYRGYAGWQELVRAVGTAFSGFRLELIGIVGEAPGALVVEFAISGRGRASGTPFATRVLEHWRFRGGRLVRIDPFYFDTHAVVTALAAEA